MNLAERLGHPAGTKLLVLHSDDMGFSEAANAATFELMEAGRITSGSVNVGGRNSTASAVQSDLPQVG